jgi:hypothetical protein
MALVSLDAVTRDDFARHVASAWRVSDVPGVALQLFDVSPRTVSGQWECFSLCFCGPPDPLLEQGTHLLDHDEIGSLELFLVPIQPGPDGPCYECVVNRAESHIIAAGG